MGGRISDLGRGTRRFVCCLVVRLILVVKRKKWRFEFITVSARSFSFRFRILVILRDGRLIIFNSSNSIHHFHLSDLHHSGG